MSKMILLAVAVVAALFGSALTFGFGAVGSVPVQAAPVQAAPVQAAQVQVAQIPAAEAVRTIPPVAQRRSVDAPEAPYTQAVMESRVKARFSGTDVNDDGYVSRGEVQLASEQARTERRTLAFSAMDKDDNGSVSRPEFDAHADERRDLFRQGRKDGARNTSRRPGFISARQFERMDTSRDGRVSLDEALAPSMAWFARADTNGDGRLSAAERKTARQKYRGEQRSWRGGRERTRKERREAST